MTNVVWRSRVRGHVSSIDNASGEVFIGTDKGHVSSIVVKPGKIICKRNVSAGRSDNAKRPFASVKQAAMSESPRESSTRTPTKG